MLGKPHAENVAMVARLAKFEVEAQVMDADAVQGRWPVLDTTPYPEFNRTTGELVEKDHGAFSAVHEVGAAGFPVENERAPGRDHPRREQSASFVFVERPCALKIKSNHDHIYLGGVRAHGQQRDADGPESGARARRRERAHERQSHQLQLERGRLQGGRPESGHGRRHDRGLQLQTTTQSSNNAQSTFCERGAYLTSSIWPLVLSHVLGPARSPRIQVQAPVVVNCAGPWFGKLNDTLPGKGRAGTMTSTTMLPTRIQVGHKHVEGSFLDLPFVADSWGNSGIYFMPRRQNSQLVFGSIAHRFESEVKKHGDFF